MQLGRARMASPEAAIVLLMRRGTGGVLKSRVCGNAAASSTCVARSGTQCVGRPATRTLAVPAENSVTVPSL